MHLTYRWRATLVIELGLLMAVLDVTIVSVVLPQIATALHNDTFFFALIACAVCAVATIFIGRDPALEEALAAKKRGEKVEESASMTVTP